MSSDGKKQFLTDILDEIKKHKNLYKLVEFKSVVAKRRDVSDSEDTWYNVITLAKMLHQGTLRPWDKQVEKDNFAILSGTGKDVRREDSHSFLSYSLT